MIDEIALTSPIVRVLASAALLPELRSILLIDASYGQLMHAAQVMAQLLSSVGGEAVEITNLSTTEHDDILWGVPLPPVGGSSRFRRPGLIRGGRADGSPQLVVIPDLAHISLAAKRALVVAIGADVVHLQRHGQDDCWQPQVCWLAACSERDIGKLTPHLLDRFAIQMFAGKPEPLSPEMRAQHLLDMMSVDLPKKGQVGDIPGDLQKQILRSRAARPIFSTEAAQQVVKYLSASLYHLTRRDLALGRLAVAQAMLVGDETVQSQHVEIAAAVVGFQADIGPVESAPELPDTELDGEVPEGSGSADSEASIGPTLRQTSVAQETTPQLSSVFEPDTRETLPDEPVQLERRTPYVQDHLPPEREAASLRLPYGIRGKGHVTRGPIIGVEMAIDLHDLAIVATVFEAAKYWPLRQAIGGRDMTQLEIRRKDLRQYRRMPLPETLLVLLIDYTSLRRCQWEEALLPHLEWAYVSRAGVALVRVGAKDARHELQAERYLGRSLLDPQIDAMLEAQPGRATPLAHGLDIALQTLHHAMQHGRSAVSHVRLVVISDGRGNVPLGASQTGDVRTPVRREGIDDALRVAQAFGDLPRVEVFFLNPQPSQHSELPIALANAMGVEPLPIPRDNHTNVSQPPLSEEEV